MKRLEIGERFQTFFDCEMNKNGLKITVEFLGLNWLIRHDRFNDVICMKTWLDLKFIFVI